MATPSAVLAAEAEVDAVPPADIASVPVVELNATVPPVELPAWVWVALAHEVAPIVGEDMVGEVIDSVPVLVLTVVAFWNWNPPSVTRTWSVALTTSPSVSSAFKYMPVLGSVVKDWPGAASDPGGWSA